MSPLEGLLAEKAQAEATIDDCNTELNRLVWRVLKAFKTHSFKGWQGYEYDRQSPTYEILGGHLWPDYFRDFEIDEGDVVAGGMYSGSRGYYEHERVRFPATWLDVTTEELSSLFDRVWDEVLVRQQAKADALARDKIAKEREDFERLSKKFGV